MRFLILIFFLLISCNSNKSTNLDNNNKNEVAKSVNSSDIKRKWMLTEFQNFSKEELIKKEAFLDLTNPKIASAGMGCNGISSNYKIKPDSEIVFTDGLRTEMACSEMKLEDNFLEVLPKINNYKIEGHKLTLSTSKGEKMVFIAQDRD